MSPLFLSLSLISFALSAEIIPHYKDDLTKQAVVRESHISDTGREPDILVIPGQRLLTPNASGSQNRRIKREEEVSVNHYCDSFRKNYIYFCQEGNSDPNNRSTLLKFCNQYGEFCVHPKSAPASDDLPEINSAEISETKRRVHKKKKQQKNGGAPEDYDEFELELLKARRKQPCTPECSAAHCTHDCKCEYDKVRMIHFCAGPLDFEDSYRCQKWFRKCPRQSPFNRKIFDASGRIWPGMERFQNGRRMLARH